MMSFLSKLREFGRDADRNASPDKLFIYMPSNKPLQLNRADHSWCLAVQVLQLNLQNLVMFAGRMSLMMPTECIQTSDRAGRRSTSHREAHRIPVISNSSLMVWNLCNVEHILQPSPKFVGMSIQDRWMFLQGTICVNASCFQVKVIQDVRRLLPEHL